MSFVEGLFLLGAVGVAGPIIAHLLAKPRFKKIPFTMLRFLRVGQKESQSRRWLRDFLILLLRCAIIVFLAMLFARPRILFEPEGSKPQQLYYIGIDNSMSMAYTEDGSSYMRQAVEKACAYVRSADEDGVFNVCSLSGDKWAENLTRQLALSHIRSLEPRAYKAEVGEFLSVVGAAIRKKSKRERVSAVLVSDFTPAMVSKINEFERHVTVNDFRYEVVGASKAIGNAAITGALVGRSSEGQLLVNVTVANYGETEQIRQLFSEVRGKQSKAIDVKLSAGKQMMYPIEVEVPERRKDDNCLDVKVNLSEGDGLEEDDSYYIAVDLPEEKSVNLAVVGGEELFLLKTALRAVSRIESAARLDIREAGFSSLSGSDVEWADVIIFSGIKEPTLEYTDSLKDFVNRGGQLMFFVNERFSRSAASVLWEKDLLAARPNTYIARKGHLETKPVCCVSVSEMSEGEHIINSLSNYRMDKVFIRGYFDCEAHPKTVTAWLFQEGYGFVYTRRVGSGRVVLVNTSCDDSIGCIMKSGSAVVFCRYLVGGGGSVCQYCFRTDEAVILPVENEHLSDDEKIWVQRCDGKELRYARLSSFVQVVDPGGIGWVRTLSKPIVRAGVNLAEGETDMSRPENEHLAALMHRAISSRQEIEKVSSLAGRSDKEYKPIWQYFIWIAVILLFMESAISNRLSR